MENNKTKTLMNSIIVATMVVIAVVIAALIIGTLLSNPVFDDSPITGTNSNETLFDVSNVTILDFSILSTSGESTCVLSNVHNTTDGVVINSGNYTQPASCQIIATDGGASGVFNGTNWNVTYSFSYPSGSTLAGGISVSAIATQFGLFVTGLIAFLAIIGTIIGVVWLVFYVKMLFDKKTGIQNMTA